MIVFLSQAIHKHHSFSCNLDSGRQKFWLAMIKRSYISNINITLHARLTDYTKGVSCS